MVGGKNIFFVYYIEDSSPNLKGFRTEKALNTFISKFNEKYKNMDEQGFWIDHTFKGTVLYVDSGYKPERDK